MTAERPVDDGLLLAGLDGSNPLAFLATLGTLRTLTSVWRQRNVKMSWTQHGGTWRPVLQALPEAERDEVVQALHERTPRPDDLFRTELRASSREARSSWDGALKFPLGAYRRFCKQAAVAAAPARRVQSDAAAAWCADGVAEVDRKIARAQRTPFDFTAGQQSLLKMMEEVVSEADEPAIYRTLFEGPAYDPAATSLRWDPLDEKRQYALQAIDPTKTGRNENPILADPGGNRLAVAGILMLPLARAGARAAPPGFGEDRGRPYWAWPIWEVPLSADAAGGLLATFARELASPNGRQVLRNRGIVQIYRSWITQPSGRYRCFTPAQAV